MIRIIVLLILALLPAYANAASCGVTATPVAFGAYTSPGGSQIDSTGTIRVTCTPDLILLACSASYSIGLSTGGSGSYATRRMTSGAYNLNYNLYTDSSYGTVWGDGISAPAVPATITSSILGLVCLPGSRNTTVYGRTPGNQNVGVGSYSDTITVTVTF